MPQIETVTSSPILPRKAAAVVIGAGIAGLATALALQDRGLDVVVVEKGEVAAEQSSRNWGWCRQMGRDPREIPLIKISLDLWRGMNAHIGAETGFRQCGIVYMSDSEAGFAAKLAWVEHHAKPHGLPTRVVTGREIAELVPGLKTSFKGGIYTAEDGRAEPFRAVPAMARHVQAKGGVVVTKCAARGLETSAGRVSAVVTEKGIIGTDTAILAGGYWSSRFLHNLAIRFPQVGVINSVQRTSVLDIGHERTFSGEKYAVRKRLDGGYTIAHNHLSRAELTPAHFRHFVDFLPLLKMDWRGIQIRLGRRLIEEARLPRRWALDSISPFEMVRVLDPAPVTDILEEAFAALRSAYPAFQQVQIVERWAGMIDATPDAVPVIDAVAEIPGLYMASGFSGHGFGLGPGAGLLMAQIVLGETPCVDPAPFRFQRFADGTWPAPTTGL